jgi:hypothetical protein
MVKLIWFKWRQLKSKTITKVQHEYRYEKKHNGLARKQFSLRWFYVKHFFFKIVTIYCFLCFVGLRPVSCVPNVASVSGLSLVFFVFFFKPSSIFSNVYLHRQDRSNISLKWFVKQLCCISRFANPLGFFSYQNSYKKN